MRPSDHDRAIHAISKSIENLDPWETNAVTAEAILTRLCLEFHVLPRDLFRGHSPGVLRELAEIFDREGRSYLAGWIRQLAEATED